MKANIHTTGKKGKGPYHGYELRLTIGMIVKDEEETLDKCLSSLQPLLDAVPSELIITDTGSTDRTVEIAEKYTDHILHFEWCGDFSAARNTGLKEAKGEWFMFIDGDEWFEDVSELIEFFNSGECDKYWTASYIQRNYIDFKRTIYNDFHALRLYKSFPEMQFVGKIHESIKCYLPLKIINDYAHHYGYAYQNVEEKQAKFNRNIMLLEEELKDDQENPKIYYLLSKQYFTGNHYDKVISYCKKGLEIEKRNPSRILKLSILHNLLQVYSMMHEYQKILDKIDDFFADHTQDEIVYLDFHCYAQLAAFCLKQYERSVNEGLEYLRIYNKYKGHQLDEKMLVCGDFYFTGPENRQDVLVSMGWCYLKLNDDESRKKVLSLLQRLDLTLPLKKGLYSFLFSAAEYIGKWKVVADFYHKLLFCGEQEKKSQFINITEHYFSKNPEKALNVMNAIAALEDEDKYVYLNRLYYAEETGNRQEALVVLEWFAKMDYDGDAKMASDVIYIALYEKINILPYLLKIDTDDLKYLSAKIQQSHSDNYAEVVFEYFNTYSFENPKGLFFTISLKERALLAETNLSNKKRLDLFTRYAEETARYVRMVHRGEMFLPSNIDVLPRAYRFGYYMGIAFKVRKKSEDAEYVKNLRLAVKSYPVMEKYTQMLLDQVEKEQQEKARRAEEFQLLTVQAKQNIEKLIQIGKLEEAAQVTAQLAALLPEDQDIVRFRKLTHTEPSMAELVTQLPQ